MAEIKFPTELMYAKSDEWVKFDGDIVTVGISDFAQDALNDIVYVELPEVGATFDKGESFGSVESVKAASDVYMPLTGEIVEVNEELEDSPELINSDAFGKGWIVKIKVSGTPDTSDLMDVDAYKEYCETR